MTTVRYFYSEEERARLNALIAFLQGRLQERETIDWALSEDGRTRLRRIAINTILDSPSTYLEEPWRSTWRLVQEYWETQPPPQANLNALSVKKRIRDGERTGNLIAAIVNTVAPRLNVEKRSRFGFKNHSPRRPKLVGHLVAASLTSPHMLPPKQFGLEDMTDARFLGALARSLELSIEHGLDIVRRIDRDPNKSPWALGGLNRVRYVETQGYRNEPDEHATGIAPVVKLIHSIVLRLAHLNDPTINNFMQRWQFNSDYVFRRLWASLATHPGLAKTQEVEQFLLSLSREEFWDVHRLPEFTELRSVWFSELPQKTQRLFLRRIKAGPPRRRWRGEADRDLVDNAILYWSVRELRRLQTYGVQLPMSDQRWLDERLSRFPDLGGDMHRDEGFLEGVQSMSVTHDPGDRYEMLEGESRLHRLEADLGKPRRRWDDDPASTARAWIGMGSNAVWIINTVNEAPDGGSAYPRIWDLLGWSHMPADAADRDLPSEGDRVLQMLSTLPAETISQAIDGITHWLSTWEKKLVDNPRLITAWEKIWPLAIAATNAQNVGDSGPLNVIAQSDLDSEELDLDTLNTPAGRMVGVFLERWTVERRTSPFFASDELLRMRDAIVEAKGRAGMIAIHRLVEVIAFFDHDWPEWTQAKLFPLLRGTGTDSIPVWRALARRRISRKILTGLSQEIVARAVDERLGRDSRKSLVFSVVIYTLHAFHEDIAPPVPLPDVTQMLRGVEDEVRAHAAEAVQRYVRDMAKAMNDEKRPTAEELFRGPAARFLRYVWPQERSLSTAGISKAFAELPAASGAAFPEAVSAIERFLQPFDCWSMIDYGLYGNDETDLQKLSIINDAQKARALLTLLDLTISRAEDAIIPHGLSDVLAHIRGQDASLANLPAFRRLAAAAR